MKQLSRYEFKECFDEKLKEMRKNGFTYEHNLCSNEYVIKDDENNEIFRIFDVYCEYLELILYDKLYPYFIFTLEKHKQTKSFVTDNDYKILFDIAIDVLEDNHYKYKYNKKSKKHFFINERNNKKIIKIKHKKNWKKSYSDVIRIFR